MAEQEIISGRYRGPLHGIPVGVQDTNFLLLTGRHSLVGISLEEFLDHIDPLPRLLVQFSAQNHGLLGLGESKWISAVLLAVGVILIGH